MLHNLTFLCHVASLLATSTPVYYAFEQSDVHHFKCNKLPSCSLE